MWLTAVNGDLKDSITKKSTGQDVGKCIKVLGEIKRDLEINSDGKLEAYCDTDACEACINAINASIITESNSLYTF